MLSSIPLAVLVLLVCSATLFGRHWSTLYSNLKSFNANLLFFKSNFNLKLYEPHVYSGFKSSL